MNRERYQAGTITQERGKWWLRYSERHSDGTIRRPKMLVGTIEQYPSKRKARLAADKIMAEVNEAAAVTRFEHLCDHYEESGMGHLRDYSRQCYTERIRALRKGFKNDRLDFLASAQGVMRMEEWFNGLKTKTGANVSASYRADLCTMLGILMRHAMKCGYLAIQRSPVDLIDLRNTPGNTAPKRIKSLPTVDQYHALLNNSHVPPIVKAIIQIMAVTGMRVCEAIGLKTQDIDYAGAKIWIRQSVKGPHFIDDDPKSKESRATVPMEAPLAKIIRRWIASSTIIDHWLFANPQTGLPFGADHFRKYYLHPAGRRAGIRNLGWHTFRHWHRALGREVNASPEQQKMMMRHASIAMAMDVYGNAGIDNAELVREPNRKIVRMLMGKNNRDIDLPLASGK